MVGGPASTGFPRVIIISGKILLKFRLHFRREQVNGLANLKEKVRRQIMFFEERSVRAEFASKFSTISIVLEPLGLCLLYWLMIVPATASNLYFEAKYIRHVYIFLT